MRYKHIRPISEHILDEVRMAASNLKQFAAGPEAQGMQAGFEAELIFTGLGGEGDYEPEWESDYDYDGRAYSISDIIDFFQSGEFADLSDRSADRLRSEMENDFFEWLNEKMMDDWVNDQDAEITQYLRDVEDLEGDELKERLAAALSDQNRDYDNALESYSDEWRENHEHDESDWLRSIGIRYMSDAENAYDLIWPHMSDINGSEAGDGEFSEANAERLADELEAELGVKTTVSSGYHGADRDTTTWIFEPDGSLEPSESGDMPVEIVSPPMPLAQTLEIMPKFFAWAEANGAYANKSTGFHMSVSMPEHKGSNLDYIKLAVFLGDRYVLEQFSRAGNSYCVSALDKIRERLAARPIEDKEKALEQMRKGLNKLASQAMIYASGFGKYVTINPKENYVEFRSAGNKDYFSDMDKIQQTMMRYARALSLAMNPEAEKQEYAKKLYKTLTNVQTQQVTDPKTGTKRTEVKPGQDDAIGLFSRYVAGEMPKSALRSFLKQLQQGREAKRQAAAGEPMVWRVTTGNQSMNVVATSEQEAKEKALREWDYNISPVNLHATRAERVGPVASSATNAMTAPAADDPRGNYVLRRREGNEGTGPIVYRFSAPDNMAAIEAARQWTTARGMERRSVWLDHVSGVPPEVLNAPDSQRGATTRSSGLSRYIVRNRATGDSIQTGFYASPEEAVAMMRQVHPDRFSPRADVTATPDTSGQTSTPATGMPSQTDVENRLGWGDQTADANYEIVDLTNQATPVFKLIANTDKDADRKLEQWLSATGLEPSIFAVRRIPQNQAQEIAPNVAQNFSQPGNTFTGRWQVVSSGTGETVYEFGGAGNRQADADRVAAHWAARTGFDDPIEVVPVMR